jgi:glycosyltransferase involved in cell wall biosynthesis
VRVLVVSGIWPPDVGGPASHAPEVARFLLDRGHRVEVVTTASAVPAAEDYPVHWVSRSLPPGVRHAAGVALVARRAAHADVVYTTGTFGRSAAGSSLARRPYVVKLTADPAFERARRRGTFGGSLEEFQRGGGGAAVAALRAARDAELRGAARVVCPSGYLRELALGWGLPADRVLVLPNPAPRVDGGLGRDELRRRFGFDRPTLAFAGRLTAQKALGVALDAVAQVDGVALAIAGEGPERAALEARADALGVAARVRFLGPLARPAVLDLLAAADALVLSSSWENFPHVVVEALAAGTPVVATAAGGVGEVVTTDHNGLLVPRGDANALAAAIRRFVDDDALRTRLSSAAAPSVAEYAAERVYGRLEELLDGVALRGAAR